MPFYDFLNKETGEIKSIFFHMNDEKKHIDENGREWERQFTSPNATVSSSTNLNPHDSKAFVEMTKNKKGNYGDLVDLSKEMSEKREKQMGKDPIKEKKFKEYAATRNGKEHPLKKQERLDKLRKEGIKLNLK
jgi:hypothetical protein